MSGSIAEFAPIRVSIEFALSNGDQVGRASFDCPPGTLPTADDIEKAAKSVLEQVQSQLGEEFGWQSREDFVRDEFESRTGMRNFAVPGSDKWAAEWAA